MTFDPTIGIAFNEIGAFHARLQLLRNVACFAGQNKAFPGHRNVKLEWDSDGVLTWWATSSLSTIMLGHGRVSAPAMLNKDKVDFEKMHEVPTDLFFDKALFSVLSKRVRKSPVQKCLVELATKQAYPNVRLSHEPPINLPVAKKHPFPFTSNDFFTATDKYIEAERWVQLSVQNIERLVRLVRASKALEKKDENRHFTELHLERESTGRLLKVWHVTCRDDDWDYIFLGEIKVSQPGNSTKIDLWQKQFVTKRLYFILDTILRLQPKDNVYFHLPRSVTNDPIVVEWDSLKSDNLGVGNIVFDTQNPLPYVPTKN